MNDIETLQFISQKLFLNNYAELDNDEKSIVDRFYHNTELSTSCINGEVEYWKLTEYEKELFNKNLLKKKLSIQNFEIMIDYLEIINKGIENEKYNPDHYPVGAVKITNALLTWEKGVRNYLIATGNFLSSS